MASEYGDKLPSIPCRVFPSESNTLDSIALAATREDDPFETVINMASPPNTPERRSGRQSLSLPASPNQTIRAAEGTFNESEFDITGAIFERGLISSTPNSSRIFMQTRDGAGSCIHSKFSSRREIFQEPTKNRLNTEQIRNMVKQKLEYLESIQKQLTVKSGPPLPMKRAMSMSSFFLNHSTNAVEEPKKPCDSGNTSYGTALDKSLDDNDPQPQPQTTTQNRTVLPSFDAKQFKKDSKKIICYIQDACYKNGDLMAEIPPWIDNSFSSCGGSDEDGLPIVRKRRLSNTSDDLDGSVHSIISRYGKARKSLQLDDSSFEDRLIPPVENGKSEDIEASLSVRPKVPKEPQVAAPVEMQVPVLPLPINLPKGEKSRLAKLASNVPKKGAMKALLALPKITGPAKKAPAKSDDESENSTADQKRKQIPRSKSSEPLQYKKVAPVGQKSKLSSPVTMRQALKPISGQIPEFGLVKKKIVSRIGMNEKENTWMTKK